LNDISCLISISLCAEVASDSGAQNILVCLHAGIARWPRSACSPIRDNKFLFVVRERERSGVIMNHRAPSNYFNEFLMKANKSLREHFMLSLGSCVQLIAYGGLFVVLMRFS
jgi:hypothetical protein